MRNQAIALACWPLLACAPLFAQAGTAASFLNLEAGAATAAVGGTSASCLPAAGSVFCNPGALGWLRGAEFTASHSELGYSARVEHLAAAYGGRRFSLALSLQAMTIGGMEERTEPSAAPLSTFGASALAPALTFSRSLGGRFAAGTSLRLVYQKIGADQAYSVANDLGLSIAGLMPGLRAGAVLTNWGSGVRFSEQSHPLPTRFRLGLGYGLFHDALTVSGDLVAPRGRNVLPCLGVQWSLGNRMDIRAGYRGGMADAGGAAGLSGGLGVRLGGYAVDYAAASRGVLGLAHQISISYRPGAASSERTERAVAAELQRRARITAETFFHQGQDHLLAGRPDEAAQSLDLALVWDPDYAEAARTLAEAKAAVGDREAARLLSSGLSHFQAGRMIDAISDLGRVLEIKPEHQAARELLQKASDALLASRPALPSDTAAAFEIKRHLRDGARALASGDYRLAIEEWEAALALDPGQAAAKTSIERARALQRQVVEAALQKAEASARQDRWPTALAYINRALELDPANEPALARKKEAVETLNRLSEIHARRGAEFLAKGDYEQAESELRLALSLNRDNRAAAEQLSRLGSHRARDSAQLISDLYLRGIRAYTQEEYAQAAALWQRVLELDPGHANARRNLERAREKLRILGQ
jgi:tetratricopeptide (TPR) repeat protein